MEGPASGAAELVQSFVEIRNERDPVRGSQSVSGLWAPEGRHLMGRGTIGLLRRAQCSLLRAMPTPRCPSSLNSSANFSVIAPASSSASVMVTARR